MKRRDPVRDAQLRERCLRVGDLRSLASSELFERLLSHGLLSDDAVQQRDAVACYLHPDIAFTNHLSRVGVCAMRVRTARPCTPRHIGPCSHGIVAAQADGRWATWRQLSAVRWLWRMKLHLISCCVDAQRLDALLLFEEVNSLQGLVQTAAF
jgi:hypothetical protein